ncbi:MAG: hypothetical protein ACFCUW_11150 [Kiloniellaceae bacterium]
MTPETATIVTSIIGAVGTILAAFIGVRFGKSRGSRGKKAGLESMSTEMNLDGTTWVGGYQDQVANGALTQQRGTIEFRQYGSRIVGEGQSEARKWLIEGVAYHRKICYVYVGVDRNPVSIGTANLELNAGGDELSGQWTGWAPDGTRLVPQQLRLLKKVS